MRTEVNVSGHEPDPHASDGQDAHAAHPEATLGPIDWALWALALVGSLTGALVAVSLAIAAQS